MEQNFEKEVITRLTKIETKLDDYSQNKEKTEEAYNLSNENSKEIIDIKEKIKWISRLIAGAIITGVIGIGLAVVQKGISIL